MKKKNEVQQLAIYQSKNGAIELRKDIKKNTFWATQAQIALMFNVERSVVTKHINNIFKDKELDAHSVCAIFAHTAEDKKEYMVQGYNLDVILSVGYRVNSVRAIDFRKWATKTLNAYITKGFAINPKQIARNYKSFEKAIADVQKLLPKEGRMDTQSVLELVKLFSTTWLSLDAYDRSELPRAGATKKNVRITADELSRAIAEMKAQLIKERSATEIFAQERSSEALSGIVGNVFQGFGGKDVYASIEEKAAHLLYFIVKNHPFVDGNKRSGAFAFVWFLNKAKMLKKESITPSALTALTVFVAESNPQDKDRIVGLILLLLKK
ncbi:MAG: virulence RhuM family protein [Candidatus Kerfeldbacteria bacterium]|nr:virulence RhuM family protein [Candidatus Kerfeldbacteria bacterium]